MPVYILFIGLIIMYKCLKDYAHWCTRALLCDASTHFSWQVLKRALQHLSGLSENNRTIGLRRLVNLLLPKLSWIYLNISHVIAQEVMQRCCFECELERSVLAELREYLVQDFALHPLDWRIVAESMLCTLMCFRLAKYGTVSAKVSRSWSA